MDTPHTLRCEVSEIVQKGSQRLRLDWATTLPAKVLVVADDFALVSAPVCAGLPAWRSAEPASERWTALAEPLCRVLPASEAT